MRKVTFVVDMAMKRQREMLAEEWRERTGRIWADEIMKMHVDWPEEWEGKAPELRIVDALDDL